MIADQFLIYALLLLPFVASALTLLLQQARALLATICTTAFLSLGLNIYLTALALNHGPIFDESHWLFIDALSAAHLLLMNTIFLLSSCFARGYFHHELQHGHLALKDLRSFCALWLGALASMTLVLVSHNLGIMWVGMEATTLLTAFLICISRKPASLEAMWKYLLICSVGVAFAFIGTLFVAAAAGSIHLDSTQILLWSVLRDHAASIDPKLIKIGFIFLLIGYGTKAGLAPMHSWLPDAHSQAPAPVSALFSGFMLNAALYCLMRYVPIVEMATGYQGWGSRLLIVLGLVSILVAAAFIIFQQDLKRLLAYCSVEHMGIIILGLGLGGAGIFAALFHTLNHSLSKTTAFFAAGRIGQQYDTQDMEKMRCVIKHSPVWGVGLLASMLALIGVAPFALFMSELQIIKSAIDGRAIVSLILLLLGSGIVFVGVLRRTINVAWGEDEHSANIAAPSTKIFLDGLIAYLPLGVLLVLGLWMPTPLRILLEQSAAIIGGRP